MDKIPMQAVGIDMASKKFDVCFRIKQPNGRISIRGSRTFANNAKGFKEYLEWVEKRSGDTSLLHVVEATGVYHEDLIHFLHGKGESCSVQLAQKVKYFAKSLNTKTKTDKVDAAIIALMGLSRVLETWEPLSSSFKTIKDLTRTHVRLKRSAMVTSSQIHAMESAHNSDKDSLRIMKQLLGKQEQLIQKCEKRILELVSRDEELSRRIEKITLIKGIGVMTVVKLLAETDGFRNTTSIRSLVSYAGLDIVENQSGSFKGRSRISKKGNAYIRTALFMPAMNAAR